MFLVQRTLQHFEVESKKPIFFKKILCSLFPQNMPSCFLILSANSLAAKITARIDQDAAVCCTPARLLTGFFLFLFFSLTKPIPRVNVQLPWWRSGRPGSVWPWGSSRWTGPSVSGPARPAAPGPARAAAAPSGSASCRTPPSGCTRAPRLHKDTKMYCFNIQNRAV